MARKLTKIKNALAADLEMPLSAADSVLLGAAGLAIFRVDEIEAAIVRGDAVEDENIVRLLNSAHRLLAAVTKRRRRTTDLKQYLATRK